MWQQLLEILEQSEAPDILVLGDFMIDRYIYGDAERISPEAPVPVLRVVGEEDALGGAGSVAADIAALGGTPHCVGVVGEDAHAEELRQYLEAKNLDAAGLVRVSGRRTTRKVRLIGLAQHKHRQQLIRVDDETVDPVDEAAGRRLIEQIENQLDQCRVLCIEDYNKGSVSPMVAEAAIAAAGRRGVPVLVDPANIGSYSRYAGATLVTPNRTETERLTGLKLRDIASVNRHQEAILTACGTQHACITLDSEGAALIGPSGAFEHVPTRKRDVYDVTGAGDEVLAALAVGIASGCDLPLAVRLANVAGGLEVEKFGCVPITRAEVIADILEEHRQSVGKIRTIEQLLPELERHRAAGAKIGFTNGCYDIIHAGHVATFAFCKQHADILVLGVNSDKSVKAQGKGDDRPIVSLEDRAAVLAAMQDVDYLVPFDEPTPAALIESVKPDMLAKGRDWEGKEVVGREVVESNGGRVLFVPLVDGISTTEIVNRIRGEAG